MFRILFSVDCLLAMLHSFSSSSWLVCLHKFYLPFCPANSDTLQYDNVRLLIVPFIQREIEQVDTASELVYGVANTLISLFASREVNFSLTKIVYESLPKEIEDS